MRESNVGVMVRTLMIAATALLSVGSGSSAAAVFQSTWDPEFNSTFTTDFGPLGWAGTATVTVSNPCISASTVVSFPNGCGSATLDGFSMSFYNKNTLASLGGVAGAGPGLPDPDPGSVSFDAFGVVDGIDLSGPIVSLGPFNFFGTDFNWELDFTISPFKGPILKLTEVISECYAIDSFVGPSVDNGCVPRVYYSATSGDNVPTVRWTQVPEPASLALLGAALAALGWTRRRQV